MNDYIPYGRHFINESDIQSVNDVLKSNFITQGPKVSDFEKSICDKLGSKFSIATNSATSALHIACLALGVSKGDTVWTSPITFVASSNCALYCGANIDFVDISLENGLMCIESLKKKLKHSKIIGKLPKVIIPVHLSGTSCDMKEINKLSKIYKFKIIEDASHALGGKLDGSYVGNCVYSDISIFSFHPVKIITTGEGGIATTNNKELFEKMKILRSHGIEKDPKKFHDLNSAKPWMYEQRMLGFNYRMNDIEAALGLSQFKRLDKIIEQRNELRNFYVKNLENLPLNVLKIEPNTLSSVHLLVIILNEGISEYHQEIFSYLLKEKIGVQLHYIPVHTQPFYKNMGFKIGDFPESEKYSNRAITLPLYPELKKNQISFIIQKLSTKISNLGF